MGILSDLQIRAKFRAVETRLTALEGASGGDPLLAARVAALEAALPVIITRLDAKDARDLEFQATLDAIHAVLHPPPP